MTSDLVLLDATQLATAIRTRAASCVEVMTAFLDHIERLNPVVNAIVSMRERDVLLAEAAERDAELTHRQPAGPLHGLPMAIKDLAPTRGLRTTWGSRIFKDFIPEFDALFVERLRRAGAIFVGKTNVPEFGLGSQTYNDVFGTTRNAYDPARTAGGSSGGAAVALALRMLPLADGSDHAGSLRNPAAWNNVLGFRPTFGVVPDETLDAFLPALAVVGPMARTAGDLALLLSVMAGYDPRAPLSSRDEAGRFTASLDRDFRGARVGWLGDCAGHLPFEPGVLEVCERALAALTEIGCAVEEARPGHDLEAVWRSWLVLRAYQVGSILKEPYADPARRALMKPEAQWEIERGSRLAAFELAAAAAERSAWYRAVRAAFARYDFLVLPSTQVFPFDAALHWPAEIAGRAMDTYHRWMEVVIPATMAGCPALNVPAGFGANGLPMGIQIVAPHHGELACLQLARAYERATGWVEKRPPPLLGAKLPA